MVEATRLNLFLNLPVCNPNRISFLFISAGNRENFPINIDTMPKTHRYLPLLSAFVSLFIGFQQLSDSDDTARTCRFQHLFGIFRIVFGIGVKKMETKSVPP